MWGDCRIFVVTLGLDIVCQVHIKLDIAKMLTNISSVVGNYPPPRALQPKCYHTTDRALKQQQKTPASKFLMELQIHSALFIGKGPTQFR